MHPEVELVAGSRRRRRSAGLQQADDDDRRRHAQDRAASGCATGPSACRASCRDAVAGRRGSPTCATALRALHPPGPDADVEALNASPPRRTARWSSTSCSSCSSAWRCGAARSSAKSGLALPRSGALTEQLRAPLPFALTGAQQRVIGEIYADMAQPHPMHRLVQGDVGSGKTIVALFAALVAIENGYQAAFMAPTELLAEQHFATIASFAEALGVRTALLTGGRGAQRPQALYASSQRGEIQLAVGTHALIQDGVQHAAPRPRRHRRAAPLRRAAARRAARPARRRTDRRHPADDRDADPAHPGDDGLRRPRRLGARRAAAGAAAGAHPCWSTRPRAETLYELVKRAARPRAAGVRRLPAGRGVGERGSARRHDHGARARRAPCSPTIGSACCTAR